MSTARTLPVLILAGLMAAPAAAQVVQSTLDATPPVQSEFFSAQSTGTTSTRLFRDGTPSRCGTAKVSPGPFGAGTYRYDAYAFTPEETRCYTIRVRPTSGFTFVHLSVHTTFDPATPDANYVADTGSSAATNGIALSVVLTAGQRYDIVVNLPNGEALDVPYELVLDEPLTTTVNSTLDATAPTGLAPYYLGVSTAAAGLPTLAAPASTCGTTKATPAVGAGGPFRFDALRIMSPVTECLTVTLRRLSGSAALAAAAYTSVTSTSFFDFTTGYLADSGGATSAAVPEVSFSLAVTAGQAIDIVVMNTTASEEGAQYELRLSMPVQPPRVLRTTSVDGNDVSFRWKAPLHGPVPTSYSIEGGLAPGQTLAAVPTGSANPLVTLSGVPDGAFYVRARSFSGASGSAASNETRLFVNQPVPPSAPRTLLASVAGSALTLTWRNTFTGGEATDLALDATGTLTGTVPLAAGQDTVTFTGVPAGTYTLSLRATNAAGTSPASNAVTVTVPAACSGTPQPPANLLAFREGNQITLLWDAPATGPAPTNYTLDVSGAFVGSFFLPTRSVSAPVPPGNYTFAVRANHACGSSVYTVPQTVVVP